MPLSSFIGTMHTFQAVPFLYANILLSMLCIVRYMYDPIVRFDS